MRLLFSKLITVTVIFIGISFNSLLAQEKLEGYLTDVATNQPVSYAHLGIRGKSRTISNEEGYFRIDPTALALRYKLNIFSWLSSCSLKYCN